LHKAIDLLAFCNVRTIYLRSVPDDVADGLARLARRAGMSLNAYTVRELAAVSRRADNPELFDSLPSLDVDVDDIVAALDEARATR
jgi:hypothetical protein